jgi:hypothetical protein
VTVAREALPAVLRAWLDRPGAEGDARATFEATPPAELAAAARTHGVAAVALETAERLDAGEQSLARLKAAARAEVAGSLALEPALEELGAAAAKRGLRAILVKGPALDRGAYPHPGLRPASDLDLLLRPDELPPWRELLAELKYRKFATVDRTWRRDDGATVDLHTGSSDLVGVIDVPEELSPVRIDLAGVFERATEVEGLPLPAPGAEDHLILCAAHGLGVHVFERLVWLLDVAVLLGLVRAGELAELARAARADRLLHHSLRLCAELDLAEPPAELLEELRPKRGGRLEGKLLRRLAREPLPDRSEFLLALAMPAPGGYKRELLKRALLPSRRTVSYGRTGAGRGALAHLGRALRLAWLAVLP